MRLLIVAILFLTFGCGHSPVEQVTTNSSSDNYYPNNGNPIVIDNSSNTSVTLSIPTGSYVNRQYRENLNFPYRGLDLSIISAHTDGTIQIQVYGYDDALLQNTSFTLSGDFTYHTPTWLVAAPKYVIFDIPGYIGDLTITLQSYN